jgi:hypothetical protein
VYYTVVRIIPISRVQIFVIRGPRKENLVAITMLIAWRCRSSLISGLGKGPMRFARGRCRRKLSSDLVRNAGLTSFKESRFHELPTLRILDLSRDTARSMVQWDGALGLEAVRRLRFEKCHFYRLSTLKISCQLYGIDCRIWVMSSWPQVGFSDTMGLARENQPIKLRPSRAHCQSWAVPSWR